VEGLSGGEVAVSVVELRRFVVFDGRALSEEVGQMGNGLVQIVGGERDYLMLGTSIGRWIREDFGGRKVEERGGVGQSYERFSRLFAAEQGGPRGDLSGVDSFGELDAGQLGGEVAVG